MAKFTFHNSGRSSYFTLETIPRKSDGFYPTSSTQINFISGSGFSDVTSSILDSGYTPFVENDFRWSVVLPPGTSSFVWPSGSTGNATTVPTSESQMAATGEGTVTIGETTFNLQDLTSFTFAPELVPGGGGGGGGLATVSNAFSMYFDGVGDYFDGAYTTFGSDDFSVSAWTKFITTGGVPGRYNTIVSYQVGDASDDAWTMYTVDGKIALYSGAESIPNTSVPTVPGYNTPTTDWINVILVRTAATNTWTVYVNGLEYHIYQPSNSVINYASRPIRIGENHSSDLGMNGWIDEVAVFTSSLDASTIESIYSASLPLGSNVTADLSTLSTPPVAWYRMGD